jgi:Flp pilus assembly pilin Flp
MEKLKRLAIRLIQDNKGQDMVEYALLAGFIAVSAGALLPPVADNISIIFTRIGSILTAASTV